MREIKQFETERLFLIPSAVEDADFVLELMNTPKWLKYIGDRNVNTKEDAEKYISEKMLPQYERLGYGNFTVVRKSDGAKIGSCGLYDREGLEGIDIGFAFLPEFEGQGYGYESSSKVLELALKKYGITQLNAITSKLNLGSQKLLEKLGFKFDKYITLPKDKEEIMLYSFKNI